MYNELRNVQKSLNSLLKTTLKNILEMRQFSKVKFRLNAVPNFPETSSGPVGDRLINI